MSAFQQECSPSRQFSGIFYLKNLEKIGKIHVFQDQGELAGDFCVVCATILLFLLSFFVRLCLKYKFLGLRRICFVFCLFLRFFGANYY